MSARREFVFRIGKDVRTRMSDALPALRHRVFGCRPAFGAKLFASQKIPLNCAKLPIIRVFTACPSHESHEYLEKRGERIIN